MLSVLLAKSVFKGKHGHDMQELGAGFFLHDLGKCDIPHDLINRPGRLTVKEWVLMRMHPTYGEKILRETGHLTSECSLIVMQHHEREDGSGYPRGLSRYRIHLYAHICALADVYDALTSMRSYKKNITTFEALRVMKKEMVSHFNRESVREFCPAVWIGSLLHDGILLRPRLRQWVGCDEVPAIRKARHSAGV